MSDKPKKILVLPGDGIGPEIIAEAEKVLAALRDQHGLAVEFEHGLIGGAAYEAGGYPLPDATLAAAKQADAILFGSIGGPRWEQIERDLRPERGLLALRAGLGVFANLRPAIV
ncbi:MAG: isocitrate/isopropylmalate family dehydrogenase, partial [Thiotrichales bacterium]|nr:isocitrate/isopropylmalate family dehydrogenase [Thiotrichales bacterium]